jgi:hypothetical protein
LTYKFDKYNDLLRKKEKAHRDKPGLYPKSLRKFKNDKTNHRKVEEKKFALEKTLQKF